MNTFKRQLFFTFLLLTTSVTGFALEFNAPKGPIILTLEGNIDEPNQGDSMVFDRDMLMALPSHEVSTDNPWNEGVQTYQGFNPIDLLAAVDAEGDMLRITALNQYITEIPVSDFQQFGAIIAYSMNQEIMSVRTKGPLMVVYDFDDYPELRSETYYGRSIWQIQSIEVFNSKE